MSDPLLVRGPGPSAGRFFFLALPFGVVANGFGTILLPVLLRRNDVAVGDIGTIEGVMLIPLALQFLWTIALDGRVDAGRSLKFTSFLAAAFCAAALSSPVHAHLGRFLGLAFAGQLCAALSFACCGSIMGTTLPPGQWGRASGYAMAGVLGGGALGGTLLTYLAASREHASAAWAIAALTSLPSLAARPVPRAAGLGAGGRSSVREALRVMRSPAGKQLLLFAILPSGAAALLTLLSSLAPDYGVGTTTVAMTNGLAGAASMAAGSIAAGIACDRFPARRCWLWVVGAVLLGCAGLIAAFLPHVPSSYIGAVLAYDFFAGVSLAIFPAVVLDVVGGTRMALTLYALYYGIGVIATTYSTMIDGQLYERHGPAGVLGADAALNIAGAIGLALVLVAGQLRARRWSAGAARSMGG